LLGITGRAQDRQHDRVGTRYHRSTEAQHAPEGSLNRSILAQDWNSFANKRSRGGRWQSAPLGTAVEIVGDPGPSPRRMGSPTMTTDRRALPNPSAALDASRAPGAEALVRTLTASSAVTPPLGTPLVGGCSDTAALFRLMAWLSPAYPVGAFSYSSGLEWAVEAGDVTDAGELEHWLAVMIGSGTGSCDAIFFVHAYRASRAMDAQVLGSVAELAAAFAPSKERHLETTAQGTAFLAATRAAWPCDTLDCLMASWSGPYAYPVSVAVAAAGHRIAVEPALLAYLQAMASNLISAGVRLIPLGQTQGQRVLAALEPVITATVARALIAPLEEVGSAAFRADIASQRHEAQYTRLFRS
jgi:urease accessory protein